MNTSSSLKHSLDVSDPQTGSQQAYDQPRKPASEVVHGLIFQKYTVIMP